MAFAGGIRSCVCSDETRERVRFVGCVHRNTHAHFAQNLRILTQHRGILERTQNKCTKITNSVNRSIASWYVPHFLLCLCETMASI